MATMPRMMTRADQPNAQASRDGRIAVIAGGGALPVAVVRTLLDRGEKPFVILIAGEVDDEQSFDGAEQAVLAVEDFGQALPLLKKHGVKRLVMSGNVVRRPNLRRVRWNLSTLALLPRVAAGLLRGDDGLLRTIIEIAEANDIAVVGPHEIVPDLLAPEGTLTRATSTSRDRRDLEAASEAALAIGRLDIGQAAIAIGGRAVALEGIEGTDGLLERTAQMRGHGRLAGKKRGVLVKHCKPLQERRADLPAIGPQTVEGAHKAGLAGIAVDAGRSFILDFDKTIARADELGLFVVGMPAKPEDDQ